MSVEFKAEVQDRNVNLRKHQDIDVPDNCEAG